MAPPVAGYSGWYDASDTASITQSSNFASQWNDKSGNAFHLVQATGANQPKTNVQTINSLNTMQFNLNGDGLSVQFMEAAGLTTTQPTTIFIVWAPQFAGTNPGTVYDGIANREALLHTGGGAGTSMFIYAGVVLSGGTLVDGTATLISSIYNDTSSQFWQEGVSAGSGAAGTQGLSAGIHVGGFGSGDRLEGAIGELIVYPSALSTADRNSVETYLQAKWNTPALPGGTPTLTGTVSPSDITHIRTSIVRQAGPHFNVDVPEFGPAFRVPHLIFGNILQTLGNVTPTIKANFPFYPPPELRAALLNPRPHQGLDLPDIGYRLFRTQPVFGTVNQTLGNVTGAITATGAQPGQPRVQAGLLTPIPPGIELPILGPPLFSARLSLIYGNIAQTLGSVTASATAAFSPAARPWIESVLLVPPIPRLGVPPIPPKLPSIFGTINVTLGPVTCQATGTFGGGVATTPPPDTPGSGAKYFSGPTGPGRLPEEIIRMDDEDLLVLI